MASSGFKKWGKGEFWGLNADFDQDWILSEEQKILREKIIEMCRVKIRPHAIHCDKTYEFPRESLNAMAELGLLGLIVPKELGGLGETHMTAVMVAETIARYGCPSTAMVYVMHLGGVASLLFRYHNNKEIQDVLMRLDKDKLVGTLVYADPAVGGHNWNPLSSKVKKLDDDTLKILKYGSWATSAGHADWYSILTVSPIEEKQQSNLSCFLIYKEEVRCSTADWNSLGMHGNQSGPLVIEGEFPISRLIGPFGDGDNNLGESAIPYFLLLASSCWNGVSMACMDLAKKHVTRKSHADAGMRVCDYPTIQNYFGECVTSTILCRSHVYLVAQEMDRVTQNNDWTLYSDLEYMPRKKYFQWLWLTKSSSSSNVDHVANVMLHACGGSGYKTDLGLERLLRDGKAGWVMAPSNEFANQLIGKISLMGIQTLDLRESVCNERVLHHEIEKMNLSGKKELAKKLLEEVNQEESDQAIHPFQDTDFENPFHTSPPKYIAQTFKTEDGNTHSPGLNPKEYTSLRLASRNGLNENMVAFVFHLPNETDHTGCLPGQYIQVKANIDEKSHTRYLSPVSKPNDFGKIEFLLKFETRGIISKHFKTLKPGDLMECIGPCGGFEYEMNELEELTLIASGGGFTPGLQIIRCILNNPSDNTKISVLYYSETYDDILYKEELNCYAENDSRLKIVHTLGEVPESWEGEEGFIDTDLINKYVTKPNGTKHKILMCGGPMMTISCLYSLRSLKFPSDLIFIYGQFGTEQIRQVYGKNARLSGHTCTNSV